MISELLRSVIFINALTVGLNACISGVHGADLPKLEVRQQAVWSTPGDGRLVMLARNAVGFGPENGIPVRVRVCVTNLTGTANAVNLYIWTTPGPQPATLPSPEPQTRHLELGECVEIDRPAALVVQDSTTSGTASGYYQLLEETAWPTATRDKYGRDIKIGSPETANANCVPLKSPTADFWASCQLRVPAGHQGVRICIGTNYLKSDDGKTQYAASLLDLIVDKSKMNVDKPSPYDNNWSPVTPDGCRDLIGASEAYFMLGPNVPGGYWDPSKVTAITVTTQTIGWTNESK